MPLTEKEDILNRGVEEIIVKSEFIDRLNSGQKMRLKMGFDPSAPDIHVGHAVGLRKLRQLQEIGHQVVLIVGDRNMALYFTLNTYEMAASAH